MAAIDAGVDSRSTGKRGQGIRNKVMQCPKCNESRRMYSKAMCWQCRQTEKLPDGDPLQCSMDGCQTRRDSNGMCKHHAQSAKDGRARAISIRSSEFMAGKEYEQNRTRLALDATWERMAREASRNGSSSGRTRQNFYKNLGLGHLYTAGRA